MVAVDLQTCVVCLSGEKIVDGDVRSTESKAHLKSSRTIVVGQQYAWRASRN